MHRSRYQPPRSFVRWLLIPLCIMLHLFANQPVQAASMTAPISNDMISPTSDMSECITIDGTYTATPPILALPCRGLQSQRWTPDSNGKWHTSLDANYCLARKTPGYWELTLLPCTDALVLNLQADTSDPSIYHVAGTTEVLQAYGTEVYVYELDTYQNWKWLQPDLDVVANQGCAISYPFAYNDTATYQRELSCDRVAKIQPPYTTPAGAMRDPSVFPGAVPANAATTTGAFDFNLDFPDFSYLRMFVPPQNWMSTGLYAPANQVLTVTVSNATAADLADVFIQLGVHTDVLEPTSPNVVNGTFSRYPSVVTKIRLEPGVNLVRSPYGGPVVLVSHTSLAKTIHVEVANAIQAAYLKVGETTEAEWLARRASPVPYAELASATSAIHVPSSEVNTLSYADAVATATNYATVKALHDQLAGLSDTAAVPDRAPQGQYRFVEDTQISAGWGHNGYPIMVDNAWHIGVPSEMVYRSAAWGVYHELGHNYQMPDSFSFVYGPETTVNLFSMHAQEALFGNSSLVDGDGYASALKLLNDAAITDKWAHADDWQKLVFLEQIRLAFPALNWDMWTQLMRRYRTMTSSDYNALNTDQLKYDSFMTNLCDITGTNLTPHFEAWTVPVSQSAKDSCATKAPLTTQPWQIDDSKPRQAGGGSGQAVREYWTNFSGSTVDDLLASPDYPNHPTGTSIITNGLEVPSNGSKSFAERVSGYIVPPITGDYHFWIAGADHARFLLSTDADPAHSQHVLDLTNATQKRGFDEQAASVQRSTPISLVAGQKYYFELLHTGTTGRNNAAIAWDIPGSATTVFEARKVIDGRFLSPYTSDLALHMQRAANQPAVVLPGSDVTFTTTVVNQGSTTASNIEVISTIPSSMTLDLAENPAWSNQMYRYVRLEALTSAVGTVNASIKELGLLDADGQQIDKSQWSVKYVDSEETTCGGPAYYAFDNDPTTTWHTRWCTGPTTSFPHELQIDTGSRHSFSGFTLLPRSDNNNGFIGDYRFSISIDGVTWVPVASGTFANDSSLKTVNFTIPTTSQVITTIPGPIAPGASASVDMVLHTATDTPLGSYTAQSVLVSAMDTTHGFMLANSTANSDSATVELSLTTPTPPPDSTPPPNSTPMPVLPNSTPTPGPQRSLVRIFLPNVMHP